jgi:CubicO group peptidase (beta-lactamase class C family)
MDKSLLDRFRLTVLEKELMVYGMAVYRKNGERVSHRWRGDDDENIYSGSKTYTSLAVGICRDEGRLALTDKAIDFFPEFKDAASEGMRETTLRDLLHMASGLRLPWLPNTKENMGKDYAREIFAHETEHKPGEKFFYSNVNTYILSRVVEKVSGVTLRDYLVPRIFDIHGIYNPQWHTCPGGHTLGGTGLYLTTEEFARLGVTLLNGGVYNDRRIISEQYVKEMYEDTIDTRTGQFSDSENQAGYGFQVWRCCRPGTWRADGKYGQVSIIAPDKDAVVTVTSHEERRANDIIRAVCADILEQL